MGENKDFYGWIRLKAKLHFMRRLRNISDGDVWWCAMGENIGTEINGKSKTFARPILVVRKLSRFNFIGVPLTSQAHSGSWYVSFVFRGIREVAVVSQVRNISVFRLYNKMGTVSDNDLELIREKLCRLILGKNTP